MSPSFVSRPWAGLDVGSYGVKLVALAPGMGNVRVHAAEVPYRPPAGGALTPEIVARAITECAEQASLSLRTVRGLTVGISGADVIVKQLSLPLMDDAEVGPALRFEARKHLPFDPQAMVLDHQVLGRSVAERRVEVLLAAVSRDHLERHLAPLGLLDLRADIVDAAPLALTNAAVTVAAGDRSAQLLLDIGHTTSLLTLYQRGEPYFSRRLDFGGRTLTQAIATRLQVPFEEAEAWKVTAGGGGPGVQADWSGAGLLAVHEALERDLVDELRRSLAFYRTLGRLPEALSLQLGGSSARLPGIAERLAGLLEVPVTVFDPFALLGGAARAGVTGGPQYAQAYGLALRSE